MSSTNPLASGTAAPAAAAGSVSNRGPGRGAVGGKAQAAAVPVLDRVLPNSLEAEMAVLGAMLLSPSEAGNEVRERLSDTHFYHSAHQVIFREISALYEARQTVDLITLTQRLRDRNQLEEIGGPGSLTNLIAHVPTTTNIGPYVDIVWEKHQLRQLIGAAYEIISQAFEKQDDVKAWIDEAEQRIFSITAEKSSDVIKPSKPLVLDAMAGIERMYDSRGEVMGLKTGLRDLDRLTSGLHNGNLIIIAGRPSMGKTALAMNIAESVAVDQNIPVGIFSLEMSGEELITRMLCSRARVNLRLLHDGFPKDEHHHKLTAAASQLMNAPLFIDDSAGLTVNQVRARARRMKQQYKVRLLVIDYMQLMRAPSRRAESSRQAEVADISAGIKALAKELGIPILVLSQLNRQPESRDEGTPRLADLRESGAIEQDADVVGLLARPEVYADDDEKRERKGQAHLIIAKQRNGPTGKIDLYFHGEYTRFEDQARVDEGDIPRLEGDEE
jgi:replicative DNA helicase